jgi:hypothetical protein
MTRASGGLLSAEQTVALQAVQLDMHFVPRGTPETDPHVGTFRAGVSDDDYIRSVEVLGRFDPARRDVFVAERLGFDFTDTRIVPFFQGISMSLAGSHLRDPHLPHDAHRSLLEDARYTRTVDAVDYGIGNALLHNVPVRYADLSADQLDDVLARLGAKNAPEAQQDPEFTRLRAGAIISRMGDIATGMVAGSAANAANAANAAGAAGAAENTPVLSALHGVDLAAPLSRLLHDHGIAPQVTRHTDVHGVSALGRFVYSRLHPSAAGKHHQAELERLRGIAEKQAANRKAADEAALAAQEARRQPKKPHRALE